MSTIPKAKYLLESLPMPVGRIIALVPYSWRPGIGRLYRRRVQEIQRFEDMGDAERQNFILERMRHIVWHAMANVPFYQSLYGRAGFRPEQLRSFSDIQRIPIVTKSMLREWPLDYRSSPQRGRYEVNTGGSSGSPLSFYILPDSIAHEWAHMLTIWAKLGYSQRHLKVAFGGRNIGEGSLKYDALRHHYAVNVYHSPEDIACELVPVARRGTIRYLHGYPSAIYDFATYCERSHPALARSLAGQLRGAFLGSEYPAPTFREKIEEVFSIPTISWYGHTERAVLAWERNKPYAYEPFQTYGFAEAVPDQDTGATKLVGTAFYSTASPLIRYDTGDEVAVSNESAGLLTEFAIKAGREGDYITDVHGTRIPLTGLMFGRHHAAFAYAQHIQIAQYAPGEATIYLTRRSHGDLDTDMDSLFDLSGIAIEFSFKVIDDPIRSPSGKVLLKVS